MKYFAIFVLFFLVGCNCNRSDGLALKSNLPIVKIEKENEAFKLDSSLAAQNVDTDTIRLVSGGALYWQIDVDSYWLTLENGKKKYVLFENAFDLVPYHYRLDYQFQKEFKKYLLFRWLCPANGPCDFVLIDKINGKVYKQLPQLIYRNDEFDDDYLIYFSERRDSLVFYNVNANSVHYFKHGIDLIKNEITPEYSFDSIIRIKNGFDLFYPIEIEGKAISKRISVDFR